MILIYKDNSPATGGPAPVSARRCGERHGSRAVRARIGAGDGRGASGRGGAAPGRRSDRRRGACPTPLRDPSGPRAPPEDHGRETHGEYAVQQGGGEDGPAHSGSPVSLFRVPSNLSRWTGLARPCTWPNSGIAPSLRHRLPRPGSRFDHVRRRPMLVVPGSQSGGANMCAASGSSLGSRRRPPPESSSAPVLSRSSTVRP